MNRAGESVATRHPAWSLWRAGALPVVALGSVLTLGALAWSGRAAVSVLIGTVVAVVALSAGPVLLVLIRSAHPPAALGMALAMYGLVTSLLLGAFLILSGLSALSPGGIAVGIAAATALWTATQIRAVGRLRILAFGTRAEGDDGAERPGPDGSPASPSAPSH